MQPGIVFYTLFCASAVLTFAADRLLLLHCQRRPNHCRPRECFVTTDDRHQYLIDCTNEIDQLHALQQENNRISIIELTKNNLLWHFTMFLILNR